ACVVVNAGFVGESRLVAASGLWQAARGATAAATIATSRGQFGELCMPAYLSKMSMPGERGASYGYSTLHIGATRPGVRFPAAASNARTLGGSDVLESGHNWPGPQRHLQPTPTTVFCFERRSRSSCCGRGTTPLKRRG